MSFFEEEQFFLNLQHLGQSGNGFYTFTDESDQHFSTTVKQANMEENGNNYHIELSHFDNSSSTFNAQIIEPTDEYECFLTFDKESGTYTLERLIAQINLDPSRSTGQQDEFDFDLSRDMDEILNSQDEDDDESQKDMGNDNDDDDDDDEEEDEDDSDDGSDEGDNEEEDDSDDSHDVFEEILPVAPSTQYSPYTNIVPSPLSPSYQSDGPGYTPEFNARSPTPLEGDSDHSEIVGFEPGFRVSQEESSESESGSEDENEDDDDDDDLDSLANDLNMTLTTGVASAPDSPRPDYVLENNNINHHSPVTTQPNNAGPMSLRALFNDGEEEEEEEGESQSNSDSD